MANKFTRLLPKSFSKNPKVDRALHHSVYSAMCYSIMSGAGEAYFSAFALFLKASSTQIGLLASLPQLFGALAQLLSAAIGKKTGLTRKRLIVLGTGFQALTWIPIILIPFLFKEHTASIFIVCVMLYYCGTHFAVPHWYSLMGDLVPERRRGRFFALRSRLASVTGFITMVTAGMILHFFDQHDWVLWGFSAIFSIAMVARLSSVYHQSQLLDITGHSAALEIPAKLIWWRVYFQSRFSRFTLYYTCAQFATSIAAPFFAIYLLQDLHYSYLEFTLNMATVVLVQFLSLHWWGRLGDVFGNRLIIVTCGLLLPFLPLLWLVSTYFWYLIAIQAAAGFVLAGFNLSTGNYIFDAVPKEKRITILAMHNIFSNVGLFGGALLGGLAATHLPQQIQLGDWHFQWLTPLYGVFVISFLARLSVAALFLRRLREVRQVKPLTVKELMLRTSKIQNLRPRFLLEILPIWLRRLKS